ncbi:hypothetical protein [Pseudomonas amygdali]|uniref:Uncharacterized protein n=1 Tax=Pseudomonas amygdali pv. lachrymans str. M301315 TaxID=629260 RepID=A0AAD0PWF2_PSEAV|nr:hypothetical protein [Pseudomonas amygdali]AXH60015.1 hypothetical protein PLA107_032840 [Pseudomonas amygdali pv. lachrymans str. M301315]
MKTEYPLIAYKISAMLTQKQGLSVNVREVPCKRVGNGLTTFHGRIRIATEKDFRPAGSQNGLFLHEEVHIEDSSFVDEAIKRLVERVQRKAARITEAASKFERASYAPYEVNHVSQAVSS